MSKAEIYKPRAGTLPARVIGWLQDNLGQAINAQQIADIFNVGRNNIHTNLAMCVQHGLLTRFKDDDAEPAYKLTRETEAPGSGVNWASTASTGSPGLVAGTGAAPLQIGVFWSSKPPKTQRTKTAALPAPTEIAIEDGIPLPAKGQRGGTDILIANMLAMKPGQSFAGAYVQRATYSKAVSACQKSSGQKYTTRTDKAAGTLRIWRIS